MMIAASSGAAVRRLVALRTARRVVDGILGRFNKKGSRVLQQRLCPALRSGGNAFLGENLRSPNFLALKQAGPSRQR